MTRRVPLIVYFKRCLKLLRGPYGKVQIRGAGSCIETAIYLVQDLVAAFGGKLKYSYTTGKEEQPPRAASAAAAAATAAATATAAADAAGEFSFEQKAATVFAAAASKLAAIDGSGPALVSISAETTTVQAHEEVFSLDEGNRGPKDAALEAAGIHVELNVGSSNRMGRQLLLLLPSVALISQYQRTACPTVSLTRASLEGGRITPPCASVGCAVYVLAVLR